MEWQSGCFLLVGLFLLIVGILIRQGRLRVSYWSILFSYYRTAGYGLIPGGIAIAIIGIGPLFYNTPWIVLLRVLVIFLGGLSLFMWLFQPRFAKPDWINWLEDNHYDIIPELRYELWRMGPARKEIINDQAKLEAWIEEFRRKRAGQP